MTHGRPFAAALAGLALVAAGGALAGAETPGEPRAELDRTGRRALALVSFRDRLGYRVRFAPAKPGVRAQTDRATRTITLFLDPRDAPHRVAHDLAHELGHAWDDRKLDDPARRAYLAARGVPAAAWWPTAGRSDYASGAGDFAEVFARCHAASPEFRSTLAPAPADACAVLERAS